MENNIKTAMKATGASKEYLKDGKQYCKDNFFRITCDVCNFHAACQKLQPIVEKTYVNGKPCGCFFMQDLKTGGEQWNI